MTTQRYQDSLAELIPELDGLFSSNEFEQIPELVYSMYEGTGQTKLNLKQKSHYRQFEKQARIHSTPRHYTYLKVQRAVPTSVRFATFLH